MRSFLERLINFPLELIRALFSSPGRLLSSGQRLLGLSLPARVAILVALFLVVCVAISYVAYRVNPDSTFSHALVGKPLHVGAIVALVVIIPIIVYYTLWAWLEGEAAPFEDIRRAWEAGQAELDRQGLDLSQVPIFLVLGSSGEAQEKALFQAARQSLNVREFPSGPSALHWYAGPDSIYVVATHVGGLSRLAQRGREAAEEEKSRVTPLAAPPGASIRGTIVAGDSGSGSGLATQSGPLADFIPPVPPTMDIRGTMMASDRSMFVPEGHRVQDHAPASIRAVTLSTDEAAEQDRRLEYLCSLVRRARRPVCPLNGVLVLLPFGVIHRGPREGIEVQRTAKRDLATVVRAGKVRCPVTAVVVGMEQEAGFRELVRRVGRDRASAQRFGKGFSLTNPPLPERLEALCAHACGAFEDWVYALFREKDALNRPGNTKLYSLLCNIRRNVQTRLGNILVDAYGVDVERDPDAEYLLFGGCYFAATGETEDRQAFVKGVFDKLPEEQAELQWTDAAYAEDRKYQRLAHLVMGYDLLALAGLVGLVFYLTLWRH